MTDKKNIPFFIFTLAVFFGLLLPSLIQDGMFMDGMIYASLSKNLANGMGSWWNLYLNGSLLSSYHDQPPLVMWIQSFFFLVFGNSMYTERIYSFFTACVTAYLIMLLWKLVFNKNNEVRKLSWLPVLLWIIIPSCFWSYANNLQENTMSIFVLLSVYFSFKGIRENKISLIVLAAICIFLSSLCKGIQGTFTIVLPVIFWLAYRNIDLRRSIFFSFILLLIPAALYIILLQNDIIRQSFHDYLQARLVNTFNNPDAVTTGSRFYIIYRLLNELIGPVLISLLIFFLLKKKQISASPDIKAFLFFLLIALCGTLPLMLTLEQRRFYLVTTFPFYSIAICSLIGGRLSAWMHTVNPAHFIFKSFRILSFALVLIALAITFSFAGKTRRDKDKLHDVYAIGNIVPAKSHITTEPSVWADWTLNLYFTRYFNISLEKDTSYKCKYLLVKKEGDFQPSASLKEINIGLKGFKLFEQLAR